jgi:molecular chaperone GrpE
MSDENKATKDPSDQAAASKPAEAAATESASASASSGGGDTDENAFGQLQTDLERFRDLALRSQADFDNFRKRAAREKEDAVKFANMTLLERLIPILDNFELGLTAARGSAKDSPILAGMEMVAKQITDFLADCGVQSIDATGQKFDPNLHEALALEESDEVEEGKVIRQLRRGFKLKDRLLRAANVVVSKGKAGGS